MTCEELAQIEKKRLEDIQILLEALVVALSGIDLKNKIMLNDHLLRVTS